MSEHFDVIVIGMGPGGEVAASRLLSAGKSLAVVERELIGGECAYWACSRPKLSCAHRRPVARWTGPLGSAAHRWTGQQRGTTAISWPAN